MMLYVLLKMQVVSYVKCEVIIKTGLTLPVTAPIIMYVREFANHYYEYLMYIPSTLTTTFFSLNL